MVGVRVGETVVAQAAAGQYVAPVYEVSEAGVTWRIPDLDQTEFRRTGEQPAGE